MIFSKWSLSKQGNLFHIGELKSHLRIIVLDDHKIFRSAVAAYCILPFFENIELIEFENGDVANAFIQKEINEESRIDLVLTDINHPGMRGQELVKSIRHYEGVSGSKTRIPIIILTMVDESRHPELIADKMVDRYLTKSAEPEDIIDCIEEILYS